MSTPAISSASISQELRTFFQERRSDLQQLGQAFESGDLNAAQQAFDALSALGADGPFKSSGPFSRADRANDFQAIGQALQSGDLAGAQTAFTALAQTFRSRGHGEGAQISPAVVVNISGGQQSSANSVVESIYQQLRDFRSERKSDLGQLGQALQSGDVNAAQQEYNALVALGQNGPFRNEEPFQRKDRVQDFEAVGKALQSGDLAGAQQAFATLSATFGSPNTQGNPGPLPPIVINILPDTPPQKEPPTPAPTPLPPTPAPTTLPPTPAPSAGQGIAEIVINFGSSQTPLQNGAGQEVVLNLGSGNGSGANTPEEVQINLGKPGQLTIDVSQGGKPAEEISINSSKAQADYLLVLNLFGASSDNSSSSGQSQSNAVNVQA